MAHLYRLIGYVAASLLCCVLLLLPLKSFAGIAPVDGYRTGNQAVAATPMQSCSGYVSYWLTTQSPRTATVTGAVVGYNGCTWSYTLTQPCCGGVPAGTQGSDAMTISLVPASYCPANSALINGSCVCSSGFVEQGGVCVVQKSEQELLCESLSGTSSYGSAPGRTGPGASTCTATGCAGSFAGTVLVITDKQGVTRTEGDITFNGSTCTYNPEAGAVEKPCQGQQGEVNGVTVCVPYSDKTNVIESVSNDSNSVSDSDSSKNKSESTQKSTKCEGNTCTTTTTTTYNYNGTTGTRSETKTESKDDFCSKNPAATQCKGGNFGGSCSGGFTCDGDAVQCAIAREQHKRACSLFDAASPERTLYEESKGATGNQAPTVPGVAITSSSFDTSNALGASACLVDVPVTIANHQLTVPFSKVCPHLDMLKAVLIAVSLLLAGRIVSRG